MLIDSHELADNTTVETDVCIIGAGAAGISIAMEFAGSKTGVCLLESGGLALNEEIQSLSSAENRGLPYYPLDQNRQRVFGGATNLWAGWCRLLDDIDFEVRPWVPYSGWPLKKKDLLPWYEKAHSLCQLSDFDYRLEYWENRRKMNRLPVQSDRIETRIYLKSPPTRFGEFYLKDLTRADNIKVLLNGNLLKFETDEKAARVTGALAGCLGGRRFRVRARHYILAAGGIENARLLMLSNDVNPAGLGNDYDQTGRYFMEHYFFPAGAIILNSPESISESLYLPSKEISIARLFLTRSTQEEEQILNYCAGIEPAYENSPLRTLARRALKTMRTGSNDFDPLFPFVSKAKREPRRKVLRIHHIVEQSPNPESRVVLSNIKKDALGMRKIEMDWRTSPIDRRTFQRAIQIIGEEFERNGIGRLTIPSGDNDREWPPKPLQGLRGHHMGTTRMSRSPTRGVVDENCRVHKVSNLFIAGSSVFPTAGAGTPTLTIIALALRLADHLKKDLEA